MPSGWTSQIGIKRTAKEQKKFNKRASKLLWGYFAIAIISILLCVLLCSFTI